MHRSLVVGMALVMGLVGGLSGLPAQASPAPSLSSLNRELQFKIGPIQLEGKEYPAIVTHLYFSAVQDSAAYYQGHAMDTADPNGDRDLWTGVRAKITPNTHSSDFSVSILFTDKEHVVMGTLPENARLGISLRTLSEGKVKIDYKNIVRYKDTDLEIWLGFNPVHPLETQGDLSVEALTNAFPQKKEDTVFGAIQVNGEAEFYECDGCEHGDQFFIEDSYSKKKVDVLGAGFGRFYTPDCPGEFHPWINQLLELGVKMAYVGKITSLSTHMWEGEYWTQSGGKLYLSAYAGEPKVELVPLLSSLQKTVLGSDRASDRKSFEKSGRFVKYSADTLQFRYGSKLLSINLDTGATKLTSAR